MRKALLILAAMTIVAWPVLASDSAKVADQPDSAKVEAKVEATVDTTAKKESMPQFNVTENGLKWADLVVGTGKEAVNGMEVECHYTLWTANADGTKGNRIQSSKDMGKPFKFKVGMQGLITGWNQGFVGMKEGGTRMLVIPPELGYGAREMPGMPANSTLVFELEFLKAL